MRDTDQLARLRVAAVTGRLPADLAEWALMLVEPRVAAAERIHVRNASLKAAMQAHAGTRWAAARAILARLREFRSSQNYRVSSFPVESFDHHVQAAWLVDPERPDTMRQLLRVLDN